MRRLIKLKVKLGVYSFVWEELNELTKTWDKFAFVCKDEPRPELKTALKNFSSHVENICELQELNNNIEVLGINLSHIKDRTYITITALRYLHNCKSPMVINTPLKDLDAEDNFAVPNNMKSDIDSLVAEAFMYIDGERAQTSLNLKN